LIRRSFSEVGLTINIHQSNRPTWDCGDVVGDFRRARAAADEVAFTCFVGVFLEESPQMADILRVGVLGPFYFWT